MTLSEAKEAIDFKEIKLEDIELSPLNPRKIALNDESMASLIQSMKENGQLVAIIVRERANYYELLAGKRRHAAAEFLGWETIKAEVVKADDQRALVIITTENLQREDLTAFEEAKQLEGLLRQFNNDARAVAAELGRSASWVARRARLLQLSEKWQKAASEELFESWSAGHLELIARYEPSIQDDILKELRKRHWVIDRNIADLEEYLAERLMGLRKAPFKTDDETLVPEAGACTACPKRSSCQALLFEPEEIEAAEIKKNDKCLDKNCWDRKKAAFLEQQTIKYSGQYPNLAKISGEWYATEAGILNKNYYDTAEKSDPAAIPAIQVDGAGIGKLRWIKTKASEKRASKPKKDKKPVKDKTPKELDQDIEEKKSRLKGRRAAWIINHIRILFGAACLQREYDYRIGFPAVIDSDDVAYPRHIFTYSGLSASLCIAALAAIFGTDSKRELSHDDAWKLLEKLSDKSEKDIILELWRQMAGVFRRRLFFSTQEDAMDLIPEAKKICTLLKVDFKDLEAKAAEKVPMPKVLQNLIRAKSQKKKPAKAKKEKPVKKPDQKRAKRKPANIVKELWEKLEELQLKPESGFVSPVAFIFQRKIKITYNRTAADDSVLLTPAQAEKYLTWLNEGNVGRFADMGN